MDSIVAGSGIKVTPYLPMAVHTIATGAVKPASVDIHPAKKPVAGLYSLCKKFTSPPFSGNSIANAAYTKAPQMAIMPPTTHKNKTEKRYCKDYSWKPKLV